MKNMQTPSQRFIAVRLDTTGSFDRNLHEEILLTSTLKVIVSFSPFKLDNIYIYLEINTNTKGSIDLKSSLCQGKG